MASPVPVRNAEIWGGLAWLAFSAFIAWAGRDLGIGTLSDPGAGFILFWAGLLMAGLALAIVVGAFRHGGPDLFSLWAGTRWPKVLIAIGALFAYAMLLNTLGFLLATAPLLLVLLRAIDPVRWSLALPVALGATLGTWWVLQRALMIQLPSGIFEIG
jgi:putative tricarboxylic transport membrane protein